jgi:uncharacterized protein (DUF2236 family)
MPANLVTFRAFMSREVRQLEVSDDARRIAEVVIDPATLPVPNPIGALLRSITTGLLPEPLRAPYGLEVSSSGARRVAAAETTVRLAMQSSGLLNRALPGQPVRRIATRLEARLTAA